MPQDLYIAYNSLSTARKLEAYEFIMNLSEKEKTEAFAEKQNKKGFGCLKDKITYIAPDFDAPLDDFEDYM